MITCQPGRRGVSAKAVKHFTCMWCPFDLAGNPHFLTPEMVCGLGFPEGELARQA